MKRRLLTILVVVWSYQAVFSQGFEEKAWESVLEELLSDEDMSSYAQEELSLLYESIHDDPLNINTATKEDLVQLPFLTEKQIEDIHAYVYMHGPMLTLGELQLTGSLDLKTRQMLRHFVYAGDPLAVKENINLYDVLKYGRNEIISRIDIPFYVRDGFRYHSPQELKRYPNRAYMGNRLSHSVRYSFNWQGRIRFGITADKDAGEPFLDRNCAGYDFWSPYLYVRDMGFVRELVIGNFKAQYGLGLLMGGGFSTGKSMALSSMDHFTQGLRPHSSTQEYGYLRGAGIALGKGKITYTVLTAYTPLDATVKGDTLIGSFKEDGYHRTKLEWSKKHNVSLGTLVANVRYNYRGIRYGATLLAEKLSLPYKGYDRFLGMSADCSLHRPHYALVAELSVLNGKTACLASQTFRLSGKWTLNSVFRSYSPGYSALHSNGMAEGSVQNETGILSGFIYSRNRIKLSGYLDLFMHPQPKYNVSEKSHGMDLRMETDWQMGHCDNLFVTARFKSQQKDCRYINRLEYCITEHFRVRWTHRISSVSELKTQFSFARYDFIGEPVSNGRALTQNYSAKMFHERFEINMSVSAFLTDSYDSRISIYESGLRYTYGFISLYGKGTRTAVNVKYRLGSSFQVNLKAGSTYYLDRDEIGSSQQRIASCHKEDLSLQLIAKF